MSAITDLIEKLKLPDSFHEIDEDNLARELVLQPSFYLQASFMLAKAERDEATAKAALEECYATLGQRVRMNPEQFRVAKITNEVVESVILTNKEYKEAQAKHIQAGYIAKLLKGACVMLEHKKKSLEGLVYLTGQGIHSAPRTDTISRKTTAKNGRHSRP